MKVKQRLVSMMLLLCMVIGLMPVAAAAASGSCGNNVQWSLDSYGTLTLSGSGATYNYTYESPPPWWNSRLQIKKVVVGSGITGLGDYALAYMSNATQVSLPTTLTTIGENCFAGWSSLTAISIPSNVTTIKKYCFIGCRALQAITLPEKLTVIENGLLDMCTSLSRVTIPAGVTEIGAFAFEDCDSLMYVTYGGQSKSDIEINDLASGNAALHAASWTCTGGASSDQPEPEIPDLEGDITASGLCGNGMTWTLTESGTLTVKGSGNMKNFTKEDLPSWNLFKNGIKHVVLSDKITGIGDYAFYMCTSIESVKLPAGLERIGEQAFLGCIELLEVDIPESVSEIDIMAFGVCYGLTEVVLPEGLTQISGGCFGACTALKTITIPASVTYIDEAAFMQCNRLETVYYGGDSVNQVEIVTEDNGPILAAEWICNSSASGQVRVEVQCSSISVDPSDDCDGATVMVAAYDADGRMSDVLTQVWDGEDTLTFDFRTLENAADVRVFLMDEEYVPLKEAISVDEAVGARHVVRSSVTQKATCTRPGIRTYSCTKCDYSYTEEIPAAGHSWLDATCLEPGICSECGQTEGDALGHDYANGVCIRCGEAEPVAVTGITLDKSTLKLAVGATATLTATVKPANATDRTVTWSSSDSSVVSVSADGKLTGVNPGTAVITAQAGEFTDTCEVTAQIVAVDSDSDNAAFRYLAKKCQENGKATGVRGEYALTWVDEEDVYTLTYSTVKDELYVGCATDNGSTYGEYVMTIPASMQAPFTAEQSISRGSVDLSGKMYISPYTLSDDYSPLSFYEYVGDDDYRETMFELCCIQSELCVLVLNERFMKGSKYDVEDLGFDAILGTDTSEERISAMALAEVILDNGTSSGSAGGKYVSQNYYFTGGARMQVRVYAYRSNPNRISFSAEYLASNGMESTVDIWYQINGHGAGPEVSVMTISANPFGTLVADAPFDCRNYEYGDELEFVASINYPPLSVETYRDSCNAVFKLAMLGFNDILSSKFGLSLEELGFDSYEEP